MVRQWARIYGLLAAASLLLAVAFADARPDAAARGVPVAVAPLWAYQQLVGQVDGRSCPSYPVCSLYARQALSRHGLLLGSWLMLDRLIHEADDVRRGRRVATSDGWRLFDPLSRNDFWLNGH